MATSSNVDSATADSATASDPNADAAGRTDSTDESDAGAGTASRDEFPSHEESASHGEADSSSTLDRLETAARGVRVAFLAFVVVFALIPAVALWFGAVPFDAPPSRPYFAFVLAALVATAALIAGAIYDV